jgi:hypothetical protein
MFASPQIELSSSEPRVYRRTPSILGRNGVGIALVGDLCRYVRLVKRAAIRLASLITCPLSRELRTPERMMAPASRIPALATRKTRSSVSERSTADVR